MPPIKEASDQYEVINPGQEAQDYDTNMKKGPIYDSKRNSQYTEANIDSKLVDKVGFSTHGSPDAKGKLWTSIDESDGKVSHEPMQANIPTSTKPISKITTTQTFNTTRLNQTSSIDVIKESSRLTQNRQNNEEIFSNPP